MSTLEAMAAALRFLGYLPEADRLAELHALAVARGLWLRGGQAV
jgi:ribosome biogenesis protein Tsr3